MKETTSYSFFDVRNFDDKKQTTNSMFPKILIAFKFGLSLSTDSSEYDECFIEEKKNNENSF